MFDYLLKKINSAVINKDPFFHIYIDDFFSKKDFKEIISSSEINLRNFNSTLDLLTILNKEGYEPIQFPGCTKNTKEYLNWEKGGCFNNVDTTEGFGMVLRLQKEKSTILKKLRYFFNSCEFKNLLCKKFNLTSESVFLDSGLQKYLNGYEISPHPDVRSKALTYMVNINPDDNSEFIDFHTHYLRFKDKKRYIYDFWKFNDEYDRCWVPWDWCESIFQQKVNNSIVIFKPSFNTLHAVKAKYNHLIFQRTQFYGNLWFKNNGATYKWNGTDLDQIPWQGLLINQSKGVKHKMNRKSIISRIIRKIRKY